MAGQSQSTLGPQLVDSPSPRLWIVQQRPSPLASDYETGCRPRSLRFFDAHHLDGHSNLDWD